MENKITSGIWFVVVGLILLLHNLDVIDFNFWATLKYWPLLIVLTGIHLMVQNKIYGSYIKIGANVLFLSWILYVGITAPSQHWTDNLLNNAHINIGGDNDGDEHSELSNQVSTPFDSTIESSELEFNGGAGKFEINVKDGTALVSAKSNGSGMGVNIKTKKSDSMQTVVVNAKPITGGGKSGKVSLDLHPRTRWDLTLNYGAAKIDGNLSSLRFSRLQIHTGASNMELTLGMPQENISNIKIATGASKIHFRIPKEAAIQVAYSSVLSKNSFEGFATKTNNVARTANYEQADKKFQIELDGAANTFTITRY